MRATILAAGPAVALVLLLGLAGLLRFASN